MRLAVFSDVHSNLEALDAVLADMADQRVDQKICLGDVVGYNANPVECLERVRELHCPVLRGNHDQECSSDCSLENYSELARIGIEHCRKKLSPEHKAYLSQLPFTWESENEVLGAVHASMYMPPQWHYILSPLDAELHFAFQTVRLCFCGHTHVPGIFIQAAKGVKILPPRKYHYRDDVLQLVNVGSVGQPRDGDWRASYVIVDTKGHFVEFHRVKYPLKIAQKKIVQAGLPKKMADRLARGH